MLQIPLPSPKLNTLNTSLAPLMVYKTLPYVTGKMSQRAVTAGANAAC